MIKSGFRASNKYLLSQCVLTQSLKSWFMLVLITLSVVPVALAVDEDLFVAKIVIDPASQQAQQISDALDTVLVKLTGQQDSIFNPSLSALRADPQAYLASFSYQERLAPDGSFGERQTLLNAQFNQRQILAELQRQNVELWSLERPEILLWLAIENQQRQREMLAGDDRLHRFTLEESAKQRGLPLVLPVQDQTDYSLVDADTVWGGFYENTELASQRYATDRFVMAAASERQSEWQVRWRLPDNEAGLETFVSRGLDLPAALQAGINQLSDRIAARAMVQSNADVSQTVKILLQNIQSPAEYALAERAFKGMSQVQDVTLLQAQASEIELMLSLNAPRRWLLRAIRLSDNLSLDVSTRDPESTDRLRVNVIRQ